MTGEAPNVPGAPAGTPDASTGGAPGDGAACHGAGRPALLLAVLTTAQLLVFRHAPGAGLAAFLVLFLGLITVIYRHRPARIGGVAALAAVASVAEYADIFSVPLAVVLVAFYTFDRAGGLPEDDFSRWRRLGRFLAVEPLRAVPGIAVGLGVAGNRLAAAAGGFGGLRRWGVPIALAGVFVALFLPANPWLALSLTVVNPIRWIGPPDPATVLMWVLSGLAVWPLLRLRPETKPKTTAPAGPTPVLFRLIGTDVAVLLLFNGVFLLQSTADLATLWPAVLSGVKAAALLPEGMTYAEFAKAGAFPLAVAAVLAAGLIPGVLREGEAHGRGVTILIVSWIVQILLLLGSAAIRLDLYVDAYGLTRLRLYTFIGMGLIATGLALTIRRIAGARTNSWLTRQNLRAVLATVFLCGATNLDGIIADNNVTRTMTVTEESFSSSIDRHYLCHLGEGALPAMAEIFRDGALPPRQRRNLYACFSRLRAELAARQSDWRSWSWRGSKLLERSRATVDFDGWAYQ